MGLGGLLGGFSSGGVGNSASTSQSTTVNQTENATLGIQDGGEINVITAEAGAQIDFTDAGAVEQAFGFAGESQAYLNENFASVIGLSENQNEQFFNAFNELQQSQASVYEAALESANDTRNLAFDNIKATTGKIASIAQTTTGDIKPILTNAFIGLAALFFITKVISK